MDMAVDVASNVVTDCSWKGSAEPNRTADHVAVFTVLKDQSGFGADRNENNYTALIDSFNYPSELMSIHMLISDPLLCEYMRDMKQTPGGIKIRAICRDYNLFSIANDDRHDVRVQVSRRSMLAVYRNSLIAAESTLAGVPGVRFIEIAHPATAIHYAELSCDIDHVLWIDADMVEIAPDVLSNLLAFEKPVVVPRCMFRNDRGALQEYDLNSWTGPRTKPGRHMLESGNYGNYVPRPDKYGGNKYLSDLVSQSANDAEGLVPIDSVGGTVLLVDAEVHRKGINFPVMNIIGATWGGKGGYDGIETEGLCYMAKVIGYECYAAPQITVRHRD